ncbi:hypothetical protein [Paraliobacillus sediminis]|uniref:hypothetical protein n=1 Tax=Paraliobacillus sediminis TaxID=1885916 RepID=UPI000E3B8B2E|nr:hypothetical protein [Paraliobacillus sediminis]
MEQNKKDLTIQEEKNRERISVDSGLSNNLLDIDREQHGDSINEHKNREAGNTFIADKVIKQTFNNS